MKAEYNIDTGCVEIFTPTRKLYILCSKIEEMMELSPFQRSEFDRLVYDNPTEFADLLLSGELEGYLKNTASEHSQQRNNVFEQLLKDFPPETAYEITRDLLR